MWGEWGELTRGKVAHQLGGLPCVGIQVGWDEARMIWLRQVSRKLNPTAVDCSFGLLHFQAEEQTW